MPALFLTLLAAALATAAGREAVRVARLAAGLGSGLGLLGAVWLAAGASSALAAWVGGQMAAQLSPGAKALLLAFALVAGAAETAFLRPPPAPREPTRSLAAIVLVIVAAQATDAARLLVLAFAASSQVPPLAAVGGAIGSGAVLTVAWALAGEWEARLPLSALRWGAAGLFLFAAIPPGLTGLGLLG